MNPNGTALSDVWRDLLKIALRDSVVPKAVLNRIRALTETDGGLLVTSVSPRAKDEVVFRSSS